MVVTFLCISMTGWLQIFGYDLLNIEWVQQFIMSKEQFVQYGGEIADVFRGNHVFLTLYNPNYAATFLIMFSAVFAVFVFGVHKKDKVWYGLLFFAFLVLLWFTYTRAALVALGVGAAVFAFCRKQDVRRAWKCIVLGLLAVSTIWIGLDALNGFKFLSRLADYKEERKLEDIQTTNKGIEISYDGENLLLTMENGKLSVSDETGREMELKADKDGEFLLPFPEPVTAMFLEDADGISCVLNMKECTLQFVKTGEGYFYRNEDGKLDSLVEIPKINMHGWEYLGSGRLYIWSRVFPILKKYILVGSGPDTFAEAYPQNDYVGKILYAGSARRIIESAHNDYLNRWVQTGMMSLVSLLVFYALFFKRCFFYYRHCILDTKRNQLGLGCFLACVCYLVCCLFSDSSLYTTPVFYVFAGIALASTE